jgi:hypothetical protein
MADVGVFLDICAILRQFDICYGHMVYFVAIWYIFPRFGILYQDKSGNPEEKKIFSPGIRCRPLTAFN